MGVHIQALLLNIKNVQIIFFLKQKKVTEQRRYST